MRGARDRQEVRNLGAGSQGHRGGKESRVCSNCLKQALPLFETFSIYI